jgi:uncharacterized membrane protein
LEFTLVHIGWAFDLNYQMLLGQVIWAIGVSMVLLAGLIVLPTWAITALGLVIVFGHNALDGLTAEPTGWPRWLWVTCFRLGFLEFSPGTGIVVAYPVLPWFGVMAAGYGFGAIWLLDHSQRRRWLLALGGALTAGFVVLRLLNDYGEPRPWSPQTTPGLTVLSFLNCTKYPPSLAFVLMTLGPAILALAWLDRPVGMLGRPLLVFGRVPLFYYLLHVPVMHLAALGLAYVQYGEMAFLCQHPLMRNLRDFPTGYGYGLPMVYVFWLGVLLILYPACRWFAGVKRRHPGGWLSYL